MPITLRTVALDDPAVSEVLEASFPTDAEARLVRALAVDAPALVPGLSLGAYEGDRLVGYVLFTRVWIGEDAVHAVSLAPLGVLPDMQGRKLGGLLVRDGLRRARAAGEDAVIVLGYPDYYEKFGFLPASRWDVRAPWPDIPDEAWLALELSPGALDGVHGSVQYPAAFNEVV